MSKRKQDDDRESESDSSKRIKTFEERFSSEELVSLRKSRPFKCFHELFSFMPADVVDIILSYRYTCCHYENNLQITSTSEVLQRTGWEEIWSCIIDSKDCKIVRTIHRMQSLTDALSSFTFVTEGRNTMLYNHFGSFQVIKVKTRDGCLMIWKGRDSSGKHGLLSSLPAVLYASRSLYEPPCWSFFYDVVGNLQRSEFRTVRPGQRQVLDVKALPLLQQQFFQEKKLVKVLAYPKPDSSTPTLQPVIVCEAKEVTWYPQAAAKWTKKAVLNPLSDVGYDFHERYGCFVASRITDSRRRVWHCTFSERPENSFSLFEWCQEGANETQRALVTCDAGYSTPTLPNGFPENCANARSRKGAIRHSEDEAMGTSLTFWRNAIRDYSNLVTGKDVAAILLTQV